MDPLIKSQLLYQLSYAPAVPPERPVETTIPATDYVGGAVLIAKEWRPVQPHGPVFRKDPSPRRSVLPEGAGPSGYLQIPVDMDTHQQSEGEHQ